MKVFFISVIIFSLFAFSLIAQELEPDEVSSDIEQDAPENLLDLAVGDSGIDLVWEGYWKIGIKYGLGIDVEDGKVTVPSVFPGLQNGFQFFQHPDVFLSLWILDRYYVEANFVEGFDKNTYAVGYEGPEGSVVRRVRLGSSKIGISEYRGLTVPMPEYNTPGAVAVFETPISTHEIMVRYDPTKLQDKVFLGEYLVDQEDLSLASYQRGQFFILTDTSITSLEVYKHKKFGAYAGSDGLTYEKLQPGDFTYDAEKGLLSLEDPSASDIVVFYSGTSGPVGDSPVSFIPDTDPFGRPDISAPLLNFAWTETNPYDLLSTGNPSHRTYQQTSRVIVNGRQALKIYRPGVFSPFERLSHYKVKSRIPQERWRLQLKLKDKGDPYRTENLSLDFETDPDSDILKLYPTGEDIRSLSARYPLAEIYPEVYGPGAVAGSELIPMTLNVAIKKGSGGFFLGSDVAPGSVQVRVNGVIDTTVEFQSESGTLNFRRYIFPDDYIEVSYRVESSDMAQGDFLIAQGNRFRFSERWSGELAGSFRWNLNSSKVSHEPGANPGELLVMTGATYDGEYFDTELFSSLDISTPDTSGYLSLDSMEGGSRSLYVYGHYLVPGIQTLSTLYGVTGSAVPLIYQNYIQTATGNQTFLNSYLWPGAAPLAGWEGPSAAGRQSLDPFFGNVVSLRYLLQAGEYSTGDLLLNTVGTEDLSSSSGMEFFIRTEDSSGTVRLALLLGENGEAVDRDENGVADSPDDSMILYKQVSTLPASDGSWAYYQWEFTAQERQLLSRFRSVKFLVEETGGSNAQGRILVGGIKLTGPVFYAEVLDSSNQPVLNNDLFVREKIDTGLLAFFPDIAPFYSSGESLVCAQLSWDNVNPSEKVSARRYITPFTLTDYRTLHLYVFHDTSGGSLGDYTLSFTDRNNRGITVRYTPESSGWKKLVIDMDNATAVLAGNIVPPVVTVDRGAGEISRMAAEIENTPDGVFRVDELHARDPLASLSNITALSIDFSKPGDLLTTHNGFVLAADPELHTDLRFTGGQVISSSAEPDAAFQALADGGIEFSMVRLEADFQGTWDQGISEFSGGHLVRFPSRWKWGYISDSYRRYYRQDNPSMNRVSSLFFNFPDTGSAEVSAGASSAGEELNQYWTGNTHWAVGDDFSIDADTRFGAVTDENLSSEGHYFGDWIRDFSLLVFRDSNIQRRSNNNTIRVHGAVPHFAFNLTHTLGYSTQLYPEVLQTSTWQSRLDFPITWGLWTLTPHYSRYLSQGNEAQVTDRFKDDFGRYGSLFSTQFPLVHFIPVADLFDPGEFQRFKDSTVGIPRSSYSPEGGITLKRKNRSHWTDLVFPSQASVVFSRDYVKTDDSLFYDTDWEFSLSQTASNMFGSFGLYPIFLFYNSDQINNTFRFSLSSRNQGLPSPDHFVWNLYFTARGSRENAFSLDNNFGVEWGAENLVTEQLRVVFSWQTEPKKRFKVPFTQWILNNSNYFKHQEKIVFYLGAPFGNSDNTLEYSLILTHDTHFILDGLGSLGGWFSFALGREEDINRVGFEAGLELIINF